jgi:integrase
MVEAWLAGKDKDGLSWWTRKALCSVLGSMFTAAREWQWWTGEGPTVGVRLGRKRLVYEKRAINSDQLRAILAALSDRTRFMVLIAVMTGLRISEIVGLRWSDIDFAAGTLTVQRRWYRGDLDEPKTQASERTRQLGPLVQEFLRWKSGEGYIFADNGTSLDERDILRWI